MCWLALRKWHWVVEFVDFVGFCMGYFRKWRSLSFLSCFPLKKQIFSYSFVIVLVVGFAGKTINMERL